MMDLFKQDVQRWILPQRIADPSLVTLKSTLKLLYHHIPLRAMLFYRIGAWCSKKNIPFFPGFIQRLIYFLYGLEIAVSQDIGGGLYIAHPVGTVISVEKMGRNCTIIASVTIGMRNEWAFPTIGDEVFIGAGARVLGRINVQDKAVIGANAVVIRDVPRGATVVGIPARVVRSNGEKVDQGKQDEELIDIQG